MFCQNCGSRIKEGEARCPKCGMKTTAELSSETLSQNAGYDRPESGFDPFSQYSQPALSREQIIELFRAASMSPGTFYAADEIPAAQMEKVMAYLSGTGVMEDDILGVYAAEEFESSISGYVLTPHTLYNIGSFMQGRMTENGCTELSFKRISKIAITNKYGVGDGNDMDDEFWDLQLYVDDVKAAKLHYWRPSPNRKYVEKARFPIRIREYAIAVNEMVKAVQGRPAIELRLDNSADAVRVPIPEQDRTVIATSAAKLFLRFLSLGVPAVALAQVFIFWMLWGHEWGKSFWPIVTLLIVFWLVLFAGSTFISLLGRCGKFMRSLARVIYIPLMLAVCAVPAYLSWNVLGFSGRYAADGVAAVSGSPDGMVQLESGTFVRGLDKSAEVYNMFMTPSHRVTLSHAFAVCDHELTQGEFKTLMGRLPKDVTGYYGKGDDVPVYGVSWYMAVACCNKRSIIEGFEPCYTVKGVADWASLRYKDVPVKFDANWNAVSCDFSKNGYRLPTEAEWEYAARAGDNTSSTYCWSGTGVSDSLRDYAWYSGSSNGKSHVVKTRKPNTSGLYDMSGNVWEWCWDWYGAKEYENCADGTENPLGPQNGEKRVYRGGGWETAFNSCTVYSRFGEKPDFTSRKFGSELKQPMGLRMVRTIP